VAQAAPLLEIQRRELTLQIWPSSTPPFQQLEKLVCGAAGLRFLLQKGTRHGSDDLVVSRRKFSPGLRTRRRTAPTLAGRLQTSPWSQLGDRKLARAKGSSSTF